MDFTKMEKEKIYEKRENLPYLNLSSTRLVVRDFHAACNGKFPKWAVADTISPSRLDGKKTGGISYSSCTVTSLGNDLDAALPQEWES